MLGNSGNSAMRGGDWDKAATYLDEALAIMLEVGECLTYGHREALAVAEKPGDRYE
ncbi:hypothetical protein [Amycolatopsis sp. TNS106]|uniref:hypothetical protein n=1 Tax=Amycolatopsis sp. TNS106 TaxID=2861750 RepID=UPI001C55F752|nr:hypothetical protein [Amycolatopsis sp. TNS106]